MSEGKHTLTMPRWGLPLYGQVLCWFFINVALVFVALWTVLRFFFGVSVGDVLMEQLRSRIEPQAELIAIELRKTPREEWKQLLAKKEEALGVRFSVYDEEGNWAEAAGLPKVLREEAESRLELFASKPFGSNGPKGGHFERMGLSRPRWGGALQPARLLFVGKGQDGGRWAICRMDLGGDEQHHPPQALLTLYAKRGAEQAIFMDWRPLILVGIGLLLLSGLVWLPFVHRLTRRLCVMTEGAERISEGDFQVNVTSQQGDEIGRLSRVIQRMAGRLEVLVDGQKRFLGDTAHELCSPLVRIRMGLGVMEQGLEGSSRERLSAVEEEVEELARMVDELLAFSKASLAKKETNFETVFLYELCEEVSRREAMGVPCEVFGGSGLSIQTNASLLKRALGNVIRNAVRYGNGEPLLVKIEKHGKEAWIGVLDRGPGLPEGWTERVFEPFARPEAARTREGGGAGLGLAIVKTCAESLGGRVFCRNRETGGLEVVLVLPLEDA